MEQTVAPVHRIEPSFARRMRQTESRFWGFASRAAGCRTRTRGAQMSFIMIAAGPTGCSRVHTVSIRSLLFAGGLGALMLLAAGAGLAHWVLTPTAPAAPLAPLA